MQAHSEVGTLHKLRVVIRCQPHCCDVDETFPDLGVSQIEDFEVVILLRTLACDHNLHAGEFEGFGDLLQLGHLFMKLVQGCHQKHEIFIGGIRSGAQDEHWAIFSVLNFLSRRIQLGEKGLVQAFTNQPSPQEQVMSLFYAHDVAEFIGCFIIQHVWCMSPFSIDLHLVNKVDLHGAADAQVHIPEPPKEHLIDLPDEYEHLAHAVHTHNRVAIVMPVNDNGAAVESQGFEKGQDEEQGDAGGVLHQDVVVGL